MSLIKSINVLVFSNQKMFDLTNFLVDSINIKNYVNQNPSKMQLSFINFFDFDVAEGDCVEVKVDGVCLFFGYIFSCNFKKDNIIFITAYDQLRYLTAKDTYVYFNKTASQVVKMICDDFNLKIGEIDDTKYIIPYRSEENQPILDIIYLALDITNKNNLQKFVLFDKGGKLNLKNVKNLKTNVFFSTDESILDLSYKTSIDNNSFNSIKLYFKDRKTKDISFIYSDDKESQKNWGKLQLFERAKTDFNPAQAKVYAKNLLSQKNKKSYLLEIIDIGNVNIHSGCIVNVNIYNKINKTMIVSYCNHIIKHNEHIMKLYLENF